MGTPNKLNDTVTRIICEEVERGVSLAAAARTANLAPATVRRWVEQGEQAKSGQYRRFADQVDEARQAFIEHHAARVREAADVGRTIKRTQIYDASGGLVREEITETEKPDWKAAQFLLERADPENWGRRPEVTVEQTVSVDAAPRKVVLEIIRPDPPADADAPNTDTDTDTDTGGGGDVPSDPGGGGPDLLAR